MPNHDFFSRLGAEKYKLHNKKKEQIQKYQDKYKYEIGSDQWTSTKTRHLQKQRQKYQDNYKYKRRTEFQDKDNYKNKCRNTNTNMITKTKTEIPRQIQIRKTDKNTKTKAITTSNTEIPRQSQLQEQI